MQYEKADMDLFTGDDIFVRDGVAKKIAKTSEALKRKGLRLKIVYGYRHPTVQKKYFDIRRREISLSSPTVRGDDLDALVHNFVAVPSVAGHPTGGAIDVTLVDEEGQDVDMGTRIADFSDPERIKTFSRSISQKQKTNRIILCDVLVQGNFAPFYGEWWHFSYGDREWACFYGKEKSLYSPLEFSTV